MSHRRFSVLLLLPVVFAIGCRVPTTDGDGWTDAEERAARAAVEAGFAELEAWVDEHPAAAAALGENLVECFLDISYGAPPDLRQRARARARALFDVLVAPQLERSPEDVTPGEWLGLLAQANYARQLRPGAGDVALGQLIGLANAAGAAPDALEDSLGLDPEDVLADPAAQNEDVYALLMASITLVEADLLPGAVVPEPARALPGRLWTYLAGYPLVGAAAYPDRGDDWTFYDTAYLATHIGYLPTGYGRHPLRLDEAPWLQVFLRENFDAVLEMGELDLVAEFVDLFRQAGHDERDDRQVRAGARHILRLFDAAGGSFLRHRESYETDEVAPYDLVHKAWTGIAGLRRRTPEPVAPGTYGAAFERLVTPGGSGSARE